LFINLKSKTPKLSNFQIFEIAKNSPCNYYSVFLLQTFFHHYFTKPDLPSRGFLWLVSLWGLPLHHIVNSCERMSILGGIQHLYDKCVARHGKRTKNRICTG
jgi:hypothetical protein